MIHNFDSVRTSFVLDDLPLTYQYWWDEMSVASGRADESRGAIARILFADEPPDDQDSAVIEIFPGFTQLHYPDKGSFNATFVRDVLDAVELICEAGYTTRPPCDVSSPPEITGVEDLAEARDFLECVAQNIERRAANTVFSKVPGRVADALRTESAVGSHPAVSGDYGTAVASLRSAFVEVAEVQPLIAGQLRNFASETENLRLTLARLDISEEIAGINFMATETAHLASCASSMLSVGSVGQFLGAAVQCGNAIAQINFAAQITGLMGEDTELARQLAELGFRDAFSNITSTLQGLAFRLSMAVEQIDASLAEIETMRMRGRRLLSKAQLLDSDAGEVHYNVNTVMRRRHNTARERYERAHRDAIRMAYLAKRALEQRLGMRLSELRDDLTLVEAPARWESDLCEREGIDYSRIRDSTDLPSDNYAGEFIGDYVRRLEHVVESYRLDFPFQDAEDTAVSRSATRSTTCGRGARGPSTTSSTMPEDSTW